MKTISVPFKKNCSFSIFGCTSSGKTYFVYKFLKNLDLLYERDDIPKKIVFCFSIYQKLYDKIKENIEDVIFHEGLPDVNALDEFMSSHTLLIIDDLGEILVNDLNSARIFTQGCHHRGFSVMRLSQNIFEGGKYARTISLNSSYLILFKSPRDLNQIKILGSQIFADARNRLVEAYVDATSVSFGYLVVDLLPFTDADLRLRTRIFPDEEMIIYTPLTFKIQN